MKADTTLTLGDFTFTRHEIPEKIQIGGEQKLAVHVLVGGQKIIDALGRADARLEWSGFLLGPHARERFRSLDALRIAGQPITLAWGEFAYRVVIQSFTAEYERETQLRYRIVCEVLEDTSATENVGATRSIKDALDEDSSTARTEALNIDDAPLSALLDTLDNAIRTTTRIANATQSAIARIRQPVDEILERTDILMHQTNRALAVASSVGDLGLRLIEQIEALARLTALLRLRAAMGRLRHNLDAVFMRGKTLTIAGGNLYRIAAEEYGNAMDWTAIAQANGLTDPNLEGIQTLIIPPRTEASDGVFNA
ncbi:putative phage protein [Candidatus Glomeribacter gigasporarum BEG34]|uniref:Putative phage protein n=1 Tax=Candidatus Glomeribacter gigasporarum BEG34 TaxID=1070319 RepID=G2JAY6_9BURK|nr:hypothetical protein [Candidatus Glomeribacter gigasporarum]CCD29938.1 putative phage protein [Candidatus Glomeribacter gigasporarum BEG34]